MRVASTGFARAGMDADEDAESNVEDDASQEMTGNGSMFTTKSNKHACVI